MTTAHAGANAILTRAAAGIGHAVPVRLACEGAHVTAHGRDSGPGETVVREITGEGRSARFVASELLDKREVAHRVNTGSLWVSAQALKSAP